MRMCNHKIVIDIMYITYYVYGHYKISSQSVIGNFHVCGGGGAKTPHKNKKGLPPVPHGENAFHKEKKCSKRPHMAQRQKFPHKKKKVARGGTLYYFPLLRDINLVDKWSGPKYQHGTISRTRILGYNYIMITS